MKVMNIKVGSHNIKLSIRSTYLTNFILKNFKFYEEFNNEPDISLEIIEGFGSPFEDYNVSITKDSNKLYFRRSDYLIETELDFKKAVIFVRDELSLKHALLNLYSSYIVSQNWGLLIHSSCVIENGKAHMFAGQSGAGKSTAARLSYPRKLLSDEATLVKITSNEIIVFNSPFRSEVLETGLEECVSLVSIHLLNQALQNKRENIRKAEALAHLMDKVFYWAHNPEDTKKVLELLRGLVNQVPAYNLFFKKDNTFWELISS